MSTLITIAGGVGAVILTSVGVYAFVMLVDECIKAIRKVVKDE